LRRAGFSLELTVKSLAHVVLTALASCAVAVALSSSLSGQGAAGAAQNQLTDAEKKAGWKLLFDGKSLSGWRGYKQPDAASSRWQAADGSLTLGKNDGKDTRGARDIISTDTFDQFELSFEWKVAEGANSGVKYFVLEDQSSAIGHEFQIIDDERHPDAKIGPERQTAALYDVLTPSNRKLHPAGQWNQGRILVTGRRVEHFLNGVRVLQYELESPELKKAIVDSKFKDVARFGTVLKGHILIQDHGDQVSYRNIKIRPTRTS
jgi:3-keto-disaccharide hydrolase